MWNEFIRTVSQPWPWYVSGPLIGLTVPILLLIGNRMFGVSSNLRHLCAATIPARVSLFDYDWKRAGGWNLVFAAGIMIGGLVAGAFLGAHQMAPLSASATAMFEGMGLVAPQGLLPPELFAWSALADPRMLAILVVGGFLVGFGASYAGGCTSGHAITGLSDFQLPSLVAVLGFFVGGLISAWLILPRIL